MFIPLILAAIAFILILKENLNAMKFLVAAGFYISVGIMIPAIEESKTEYITFSSVEEINFVEYQEIIASDSTYAEIITDNYHWYELIYRIPRPSRKTLYVNVQIIEK